MFFCADPNRLEQFLSVLETDVLPLTLRTRGDIINFHYFSDDDRIRTYVSGFPEHRHSIVGRFHQPAHHRLRNFRRNINLSSFVEFYIVMPNVPDLHHFLVSYWVANPITYDLKQVVSYGLVISIGDIQ